jgi:hypothetical protein
MDLKERVLRRWAVARPSEHRSEPFWNFVTR